MANFTDDATTIAIPRGSTLKLLDGTAVTPQEITLRVGPGNLTITNGGHSSVRGKDANGDFFGYPRKGEQAGLSSVAISGVFSSPGDDATVFSIADLCVANFSSIASWVNTTASDVPGGTFDLVLTIPTHGAITGATYTLNDANAMTAGSSVTNSPEGYTGTVTLESGDAVVTIAQV